VRKKTDTQTTAAKAVGVGNHWSYNS